MSENSIYKWTFRDERGRTAALIDTNFLDAEARAYDLLSASDIELIHIEEIQK